MSVVLIAVSLLSLITPLMITDDLPVRTFRHGSKREPVLSRFRFIEVSRLMLITGRFPVSAPDGSENISSHPMTLLEELQARILAKTGSETESAPIAPHSPPGLSPQSERAALNTAHDPRPAEPAPSNTEQR